MTTIGNTTINGFARLPVNNNNQQSSDDLSFPEGGYITGIQVYAAASISGKQAGSIVVWGAGASYPVLYQQSVTFPLGTGTVGGQSWVSVSVPNFFMGRGQAYRVGFWSQFDGQFYLGFNTSAGQSWEKAAGGGVTDFSGGASAFGTNGYQVTYTPVGSGVKTWNGSAFAKHPVKTWNGSAWVWHPTKTWTGSAWAMR